MARARAHRSTACSDKTDIADRADVEPDFALLDFFGADAPRRVPALRPAPVVDGRAADFCERWAGDEPRSVAAA